MLNGRYRIKPRDRRVQSKPGRQSIGRGREPSRSGRRAPATISQACAHNLTPSQHAVARQQQRGVPQIVIGLVATYGKAVPAGGGTTKYFFTGTARMELAVEMDQETWDQVSKHMDVYIVVCDTTGTVITVGRINSRIRV